MPASSWGEAMPERTISTGQIVVTPSLDEIAAFTNAVGFGLDTPPDAVAITPFLALSWLAKPELRGLVTDACPAGSLPMQVSQEIEVSKHLTAGEAFTVAAALQGDAQNLQLTYTVTDSAGAVRTNGEIGFVCVALADLYRVIQ